MVLLIIASVGIGGYFIYTIRKEAPQTQVAQPAKPQKKAKAQAPAVKSQPKQTVNFDRSQIQADFHSTVGTLNAKTSTYVSPVDSNQNVLINNSAQRSASSIKIFIMVTAYSMAKEHVFNLDDMHSLTADEKVGGTGVLQNMSDGTQLTYREIIQYMIDDSDNTAANIIIDQLGGFDLINNKIKSLGANDTELKRKMMDTAALDSGVDNLTSARDLGLTLKKLYNHELVSRTSDDEMLSILQKNQNHNKLSKLLPSAATVYNKTGEFSTYGVENDAEIVKNDKGAFVAVVMSQDGTSNEQIAAMNQFGLKLYQGILE